MITEPVLLAIVAAAASTVASLITLLVSIVNNRKIDTVQKATNGMKDALVAAAEREGHAEGVRDEKIKEAAQSTKGKS